MHSFVHKAVSPGMWIIPESPQKDKRHDFGKDVRNSLGGEKNQNALFSALETSPNT